MCIQINKNIMETTFFILNAILKFFLCNKYKYICIFRIVKTNQVIRNIFVYYFVLYYIEYYSYYYVYNIMSKLFQRRKNDIDFTWSGKYPFISLYKCKYIAKY